MRRWRGGALDECDVRCTAAQRLDADSAGAGVEIGEARAFDLRREDVEERFAQAIAGGARRHAARRGERAAAIGAGDDTHGDRRTRTGRPVAPDSAGDLEDSALEYNEAMARDSRMPQDAMRGDRMQSAGLGRRGNSSETSKERRCVAGHFRWGAGGAWISVSIPSSCCCWACAWATRACCRCRSGMASCSGCCCFSRCWRGRSGGRSRRHITGCRFAAFCCCRSAG